MSPKLRFDPARVAYYEKAGWEAYYDRKWLRVLWLMVQLNRQMFAMPWWTAMRAALNTVRAARVFAPVENDLAQTEEHLARFYEKARVSAGIQAEARALARLELDYWVVHRQLAIRRQQNHADGAIEPMVQSLTRLHAVLFNAPEVAMRPSAEYRAQAAVAVDRITGRYSTDVAADWREVERSLQQAYQAVLDAQASVETDA
jgi:hypothetical protein